MLRIHADIQRMQDDVRAIVERVRVHDRELASQMRRSAQAVALGLAEGTGASGGNRRLAYERALKEARECQAAIEVARRWRYIGGVEPAVHDRMDKIRATLYRLARPR